MSLSCGLAQLLVEEQESFLPESELLELFFHRSLLTVVLRSFPDTRDYGFGRCYMYGAAEREVRDSGHVPGSSLRRPSDPGDGAPGAPFCCRFPAICSAAAGEYREMSGYGRSPARDDGSNGWGEVSDPWGDASPQKGGGSNEQGEASPGQLQASPQQVRLFPRPGEAPYLFGRGVYLLGRGVALLGRGPYLFVGALAPLVGAFALLVGAFAPLVGAFRRRRGISALSHRRSTIHRDASSPPSFPARTRRHGP